MHLQVQKQKIRFPWGGEHILVHSECRDYKNIVLVQITFSSVCTFTYLELWSPDDDVNRVVVFSGFNRHIFDVKVLAGIRFL